MTYPFRSGLIGIILVVAFLWLPEGVHAASEVATFESFYRSSTVVYWVAAAVLAILAGALIFYTGGTASPIVIETGTWIGGLMGYSGAAATNAGLALLGGGSIATGGFGIIGGAALLTAAFSFGTSVVFDFAAGKAVVAYEYSKFQTQSKSMTNLPLPKNSSGSDAYEAAMKVLKDVDGHQLIGSNQNQDIVGKAIRGLNANTLDTPSNAGKSRDASMLALLHFVSNDYAHAKESASFAYELANGRQLSATLPAFIFAASALYDEAPNFEKIMEKFSYSILSEPDNPITPLLFAIFLDRAMYRFNDGYLTGKSLMRIYDVSRSLTYDERLASIQIGMLTRHFVRIKLEQQKIISLTQSDNKTIKESPQTLRTVRHAIGEYKSLITANKSAIDEQVLKLDARLNSNISLFEKMKGHGIKDWETQWRGKLAEMQTLWTSYSNGVSGLEAQIRELEQYQASLASKDVPVSAEAPAQSNPSQWLLYLAAFAGLVVASLLVLRFRSVK